MNLFHETTAGAVIGTAAAVHTVEPDAPAVKGAGASDAKKFRPRPALTGPLVSVLDGLVNRKVDASALAVDTKDLDPDLITGGDDLFGEMDPVLGKL